MVKVVAALWKIDRLLLATYLIALWGLLMIPIAGPDYGFFGIGIDKWMHIALFGGLAVFVRWNLTTVRHTVLYSIGAAFLVAAATEAAQGLLSYRSMDFLDLLAGTLGAMVGTIVMHRILMSPVPQKAVGSLVFTLGLMICGLFFLADVIGVGSNDQFGKVQIAGSALGAIIVAGGIWVYAKDLPGNDDPRNVGDS
jgi:hypothetical protein